MRGLYIHIPFCKSRCIYCDFYSTTLYEWQNRYVDALCREMEMRCKDERFSPLSTVYLGGGTPSQLSAENLVKLFDCIHQTFGLSSVQETTMECNPDDVDDDFCEMLRELPVNRISMGAQTFSDQRLRFLHRRHTARQVEEAVDRLRRSGIRNISIDLIFGFPSQTLREWEHDVDAAVALGVEHISAYNLMYEKGTPLYEMQKKSNQLKRVDEEDERQMYELLIERLANAGFEHYEISNFAKLPRSSESDIHSFRSLHNSSYWNQTPYVGIGAAAHSYDGKVRSWNVADLRKYVKAIEQGSRPFEYEVIDEVTKYNDLITTSLRTIEGIDANILSEPYRSYLLANAEKYVRQGLMSHDDLGLHLTRKGLFISDFIMSDLIY